MIPLLEPGDVVAIMQPLGWKSPLLQQQHHLGHEAGRTPAVHQDVMVGPDQPMTVVVELDESETLQRRARQIEPLGTLAPRERTQRIVQCSWSSSGCARMPVLLDESHLGVAIDDLLRRSRQLSP